MKLPNEVLEQMFQWLVCMAPPRLGHDCYCTTRGWLTPLWTCRRWRTVIQCDPHCWALAYTQLPGFMSFAQALASGVPLTYAITLSVPTFIESPAPNTRLDINRTNMIRHRAAFNECGSIVLDSRGDMVEHLKDIERASVLTSLPKLTDVVVRASSTDPKVMEMCR